jgi:hypothetical protein
LVDRFTIPEDRWQEKDSRLVGIALKPKVIEQYGQPVVSPTGDIYTWKRTPDTYSILKWIWTDGPDAPIAEAVAASKEGLMVYWNLPTQNAEEVEGYEIVRSTDVCGPFKPVGSVAKGVLQFEDTGVENDTTYYYQVRAIKKEGYSGYSNKAVGVKK